jgi:flagellar basal body-associated protein FliL
MTKAANYTARPATGRSFLAIIVVATLSALAVMVWTFHFASDAEKKRGTPATFRM